MRHTAEERREFQRLTKVFELSNPRELIRLFNSYSMLKLLDHGRRLDGARGWPHRALMRALFTEEYRHEPTRSVTEEPSEDRRRLLEGEPDEIFGLDSLDGGYRFTDWDLGEIISFVQLVVLPAASAEPAKPEDQHPQNRVEPTPEGPAGDPSG